MSEEQAAGGNHLKLAADVVSAYVSKNPIPAAALPELIHTVHATFGGLANDKARAEVVAEPKAPAVSIKKSVTPDYIICLEDGKKFKSLKRHLRAAYHMTPADYRAKWSLPREYPMVAPAYAAARSAMAKEMGLGRKAAPPPAAAKGRRAKKAA